MQVKQHHSGLFIVINFFLFAGSFGQQRGVLLCHQIRGIS